MHSAHTCHSILNAISKHKAHYFIVYWSRKTDSSLFVQNYLQFRIVLQKHLKFRLIFWVLKREKTNVPNLESLSLIESRRRACISMNKLLNFYPTHARASFNHIYFCRFVNIFLCADSPTVVDLMCFFLVGYRETKWLKDYQT